MSVIRILGIPGSIRKASTNLGLLRAAGQLLADTPGVEFAIADISHLPLYNSDLETQAGGAIAFPEAVTAFREQVANADAILFATAEYNYSISSTCAMLRHLAQLVAVALTHSHSLSLSLSLALPQRR